jgi:16S rRNA (adenine1518-N6/adenine1519-N6)-dimethyltransferase
MQITYLTRSEILQILQTLNIRPRIRLGQVFLADSQVVKKQIEFAELSKKDIVLEIGPGLGVLTHGLAKQAGKVIAVEYDKILYSFLKSQVADNVELIQKDAIKLQFPKFNKLVANLPYQISSPIIFKLTEYDFNLAIIMLQVEFVNRLVAKPGSKEYSRLTVMSSYYFDIDLLAKVPSSSFHPVPKVDSAIIRLIPKKEKAFVKDKELFKDLIKIVFNERRKMIKNSITDQLSILTQGINSQRYSFGKGKDLKITNTSLKELIPRLSRTTDRPEQLTLEELIELSNELYDLIENA